MLGMRSEKSVSKPVIPAAPPTSSWISDEVPGAILKDVRLAKRFGKLLGVMSAGIGESVPYACQDWPQPPDRPRMAASIRYCTPAF